MQTCVRQGTHGADVPVELPMGGRKHQRLPNFLCRQQGYHLRRQVNQMRAPGLGSMGRNGSDALGKVQFVPAHAGDLAAALAAERQHADDLAIRRWQGHRRSQYLPKLVIGQNSVPGPPGRGWYQAGARTCFDRAPAHASLE